MIFLVDFNLDGYALLLLGILTKLGWLELVSIRFVTFREAGLFVEIVLDIDNYMGVGRLFIP
jgi:hypothetical protein